MRFVLAAVMAMSAIGCTGNVKSTTDSTKVEVEVPKIEVGPQKVDMDPRTDGDIDVKTPTEKP